MRERMMNSMRGNSRLLDTEQLREYTNLGRNSAMKFGEEAGAKVKIGRRVLWDLEKVNAYISKLTEE